MLHDRFQTRLPNCFLGGQIDFAPEFNLDREAGQERAAECPNLTEVGLFPWRCRCL